VKQGTILQCFQTQFFHLNRTDEYSFFLSESQEIIDTQWPFQAVLQDIYKNWSFKKRETEDWPQIVCQPVIHKNRKESRASIEKDKHSSRLQSTLNWVGKHKLHLTTFLYRLVTYSTKTTNKTTNKRLAKQHRRDKIYVRGEQVKQPCLFRERAP